MTNSNNDTINSGRAPQYVTGIEGLEIVSAAGIGTSKTSWYTALPSLPGVIRIGKRYYVPRDIVHRMANGGQSCPKCDAIKAEAQGSMPASNNLDLEEQHPTKEVLHDE